MRGRIFLPVIDALIVRNYPLFPGEHGRGLELEFASGVTVLAGINGVGKTTLLMLILRLLLGPCDPVKADNDLGRVSKRKLVLRRKYSFFQDRVAETLGENAVGTLDFKIGAHEVSVTRYLANMSLKLVYVDGRKIRPESELDFIDRLSSLAKLPSAYDFHILVRYLQFFSEERLPILWSPGTQFEFFKILFFSSELSRDLNDTFASVQRVDSDYRNRRNQLTRRENELPETPDPARLERDVLVAMRSDTLRLYQEISRRYQTSYAQYRELQDAARAIESELAETEAAMSDWEQEFAQADSLFIAQALPSLDDKLQFLMQGLGTGRGCFVCGTRGEREAAAISRKLRQGHCFVCNASIGNTSSRKVVPMTAIKVRQIEEKLNGIRTLTKAIAEKQDSNSAALAAAGLVLKEAANERAEVLRALNALTVQIPDEEPSALDSLRDSIARETEQLEILDAERKALTERYRVLVNAAQLQMDDLKEEIRSSMTHYSEAFIQEAVRISFKRQTPFKLATGAGQVNIPTFSVAMTSSTHHIAKERLSSENVSESQKEFLDLAFRMTLLDLINPGQPTMMVVETPEASLDTWFMRRAADLMREFAPEDSHSRKMLATSNLNGTKMIPALLGILSDDDKTTRLPPSRSSHLVDLMALSATATVLKEPKARRTLEEELGRYKNG